MPPAKDIQDDSDETGHELRRVRIRELELKRARGVISCAECRRLKLKCDKKIPCSSCKRRGCQHICPTGPSSFLSIALSRVLILVTGVNNTAASAAGGGASLSSGLSTLPAFDAPTSASAASGSASGSLPISAVALASVSDSARVLQKLTA
ncbi:hypothetical protein EW145_g7873, partial [Phellinidium pouzarii]